jgi:hypothetical protein
LHFYVAIIYFGIFLIPANKIYRYNMGRHHQTSPHPQGENRKITQQIEANRALYKPAQRKTPYFTACPAALYCVISGHNACFAESHQE